MFTTCLSWVVAFIDKFAFRRASGTKPDCEVLAQRQGSRAGARCVPLANLLTALTQVSRSCFRGFDVFVCFSNLPTCVSETLRGGRVGLLPTLPGFHEFGSLQERGGGGGEEGLAVDD